MLIVIIKVTVYRFRSFYGKTGIELTYGRVPIGPSDFSLNYYSYDDTVDDIDMTFFNLTDFDFTTKVSNKALSKMLPSHLTKNLLTEFEKPSQFVLKYLRPVYEWRNQQLNFLDLTTPPPF